jgi:hypothetical protein
MGASERRGAPPAAVAAGVLLAMALGAILVWVFWLPLGRDEPSAEARGGAAASPEAAGGEATTTPRTLGPMAVTEGTTEPDLSGSWELVNHVDVSTYAPYVGLRLGYRLRLEQRGTQITGTGEKWTENGRALPAAQRTPLRVEGTVEGGRVRLTFSEQGRRRQSDGRFEWQASSDGSRLDGRFESTAAGSSGRSTARRR